MDKPHIFDPTWGEHIIANIIKPGVHLKPSTLNAILKFLSKNLIPSLNTWKWGHDMAQGLDQRGRTKALVQLSQLSKAQKSRLAFAEYLIFKYLKDLSPEVRITALHAALTAPVLMIHMEKKLVAALERQEPGILDIINDLKKVLDPGFMPLLDSALMQGQQKFSTEPVRPRLRCEKVRF